MMEIIVAAGLSLTAVAMLVCIVGLIRVQWTYRTVRELGDIANKKSQEMIARGEYEAWTRYYDLLDTREISQEYLHGFGPQWLSWDRKAIVRRYLELIGEETKP